MAIRRPRAAVRVAWALALSLVATAAFAESGPRNVLVLYSNGRLLRASVAFDRGIREALVSSEGSPLAIYDEFLDVPRFHGERYSRTMVVYLREKYAAHAPDLIVTYGEDALQFIVDNHDEFHPEVPVIHAGVPDLYLRTLGRVPADVVGVPIDFDFDGTIEQALRWHPEARKLVIVTGSSHQDRAWDARVREAAAVAAGRVEIEYLTGLPTPAVLKRLRALGSESVVFTTGYFQDGDGRDFIPREAARMMAQASGAPVYGAFATFVGLGIVGARSPDFEEIGRQTGRLVGDVLRGTDPRLLRLPPAVPTRMSVDWREIRRWRIPEAAVPPDTVIEFRTRTFLEQYRNETIAGLVLVLLQAALIAGLVLVLLQAALIAVLLAERRRRRLAEIARMTHRMELAHASRLAVAGELTASIAHEINQPLGAILSNADAAELILDAGGDRSEELRQILDDIRRDDRRASEVIRRLKALLARQEVERQPFEVNDAVREAESLLRSEATRRGVSFEIRPVPGGVTVVGDRVQVQQVLLNLMLNAIDAVAGLPEDRRVVSVSVERAGSSVDVAVTDRGIGIAPDEMPRLFDSFFTTKRQGMGLGLSIARSIVEAHGGQIRAESHPGDGAVFRVGLPVAGAVPAGGAA